MINDTHLIDLINLLNITISQYAFGIIWLMGNIGSILTCIIFYQPTFRKSPCAMYFLASSCSQLLAFNFALLSRMLQFGYNIQTINMNLWFCKIRFYLFYVLIANSRYNIIMASIDRFFSSSRDALRRRWSSCKIALRVIISNAIFWNLMYIQVLVFYEIKNNICQPQSGLYGIFFSIYITIDSGILPILLMLIFGLLTANNVGHTNRRIEPGTTGNNNGQSIRHGKKSKTDGQLQKMLINQIILFIFLNIPNPCYLIYQSITMHIPKSPVRLQMELFINNMTFVPLYLGFALTFINFMISSKMFRREFFSLLQVKILRRPPKQSTGTEGATAVRNGLRTDNAQ
ncbi:hypothetical protein I4U23_003515 [Adineta vaga]|nr:hypothetical protein I4U23_003515 [Adineta vaga]